LYDNGRRTSEPSCRSEPGYTPSGRVELVDFDNVGGDDLLEDELGYPVTDVDWGSVARRGAAEPKRMRRGRRISKRDVVPSAFLLETTSQPPTLTDEIFPAKVEEQDEHAPPIIRIDHPGPGMYRMFRGEAGSRSYPTVRSERYGNGELDIDQGFALGGNGLSLGATRRGAGCQTGTGQIDVQRRTTRLTRRDRSLPLGNYHGWARWLGRSIV
jgi:hypothetical protein